jgi:hypothetical protein
VEWVDAIQTFVVSGADACAEVLKHPGVYSSANVEGAHTERIHTEVLRRAAADPRMADLRARGYGMIKTMRVLLNADPRRTRGSESSSRGPSPLDGSPTWRPSSARPRRRSRMTWSTGRPI